MPTNISLINKLYYFHKNDIDVNNREVYLIPITDYISGIGAEGTDQPGVIIGIE